MIRLTQVRSLEHVCIKVAGDVDPHAIEHFRRQLFEAVTDETRCVTVDAARLGYLYSDGLDVLVELARRLRRSGGEVRLINAAGWLCRLLEQTRLNQIVTVCDGPTQRATDKTP